MIATDINMDYEGVTLDYDWASGDVWLSENGDGGMFIPLEALRALVRAVDAVKATAEGEPSLTQEVLS